MQLRSVISWAIFGPLLIYMALMTQVIVRHMSEPAPLPKLSWPKSWSDQQIQATKESRKSLLLKIKEVYSAKPPAKARDMFTEDLVFEDMLQVVQGFDMFEVEILKWFPDSLVSMDYKVNSMQQNEKEILLDQSLHMQIKYLPWPKVVSIPMRAHIMLDPSEPKNPKIYHIKEDWWGHSSLNPQNTFPLLGKVHTKLREFTGLLLVKILQLFY